MQSEKMKNERMTIKDMAGFCPEDAIWKMMADISKFLLKDDSVKMMNPESIVVDGNMFIAETTSQEMQEFLAPEQEGGENTLKPQLVWQLGAVAYYMATGHVIFGGHGSKYQQEHPHVALPVLPKNYQTLTRTIQHCLCYNINERISLKELSAVTEKEWTACSSRHREKVSLQREPVQTENQQKVKWPEEMIEI